MAPAEDSADKSAVKIDDESSIPIPQRPPTPERLDRRFRRLDGLLVLVVLLFAFLMAFFPAYNGDFFFHAATGRLIAQGKYQVGVDPFAFTTQGAVWINHNWLYDLVVFLIYNSSAAGGTILIVLKALIVAALAYVMLRAASEPGRSLWIPAACVGLAVLALSPARVFAAGCDLLLLPGRHALAALSAAKAARSKPSAVPCLLVYSAALSALGQRR